MRQLMRAELFRCASFIRKFHERALVDARKWLTLLMVINCIFQRFMELTCTDGTIERRLRSWQYNLIKVQQVFVLNRTLRLEYTLCGIWRIYIFYPNMPFQKKITAYFLKSLYSNTLGIGLKWSEAGI